MPHIRPFRALRYNQKKAGHISELTAPPYDIIYDKWRERLYDRNPYNIIRLIKTKEVTGDAEAQDKYERANAYIQSWMSKGVLEIDDTPSVYIRSDTYELDGILKTRYGFIMLLRVEDFGNGVYPHERTLSAPRADRMNLVKATKTNLSQIFSIYKDNDGSVQDMILKAADPEPDIDFQDEQGIRRRMWKISNSGFAGSLIDAMKDRDIIIADGHHRYETALAYRNLMEATRKHEHEPFDYVSMYFSSADADGMTILPTHRKVLGLESFDAKDFFEKLSTEYDVEFAGNIEIPELLKRISLNSDKQNIFGLFTRDGFRIARLRNPSVPKDNDVEVLHDNIIEKILNVTREDIASGRYLHFCKSCEHAIEDVASGNDNCAIFMNALTTDELFRKILDGDRMPQKSTYFYPKTLSGLVMYKIDRQSIEG
ncbi:DUF1015 domain-containing protein [Candidatus Omnitrophota bacterium]